MQAVLPPNPGEASVTQSNVRSFSNEFEVSLTDAEALSNHPPIGGGKHAVILHQRK